MKIKDKVIEIKKADCMLEAEEIFIKIAGLTKEGPKFDRLRKNADEIKKGIEERVSVKVIYSYSENISLNGKELNIEGEKFQCNAFEQIDQSSIEGAYIYVLTAGDFRLEEQPIMDQLLADLWGTSFTDTARNVFERTIEKESILSNAFGPGFYGMKMEKMQDISRLVDFSKIGVELKDSGILVPIKSCAGIYLKVNDTFERINTECEDCKGTVKSCNLCNLNKRKDNMDKIINGEKNFKCTGICSECGRCKDGGRIAGTNKRKTKMIVFPKDFIPEKGEQGYGIAFDIGTTTVVGMLMDLHEGKQLSAIAKTNPQNVHGLDVISRINFAETSEENLNILRTSIVECLNDIIKEICEENNINYEAIVRVAVAGNTTMAHIFAGYNPRSLAQAPFNPMYEGTLIFKGKSSGLNISDGGAVMLFPNIAGHVGGDITAGLLASRFFDEKELTLFIDIGTNGEIALTDGNRFLTCSTAAGPAFEGAAIYQGMRASNGAIEKVKIEEGKVLIHTIEDAEPVGICGSGLIDAIAEMLRHGLINKTGRIITAEDLNKKNPNSGLEKRLRDGNGGREFVLVFKEEGEDIVVTQKDIREVQLAKGAIYAGISIMLNELAKSAEDISKVILAGAFGNFIDKESAVQIGLLPKLPIDKIYSAGNTAGVGTLMAVGSAKEGVRAKAIPEKMEHIELASMEDFQEQYLKAMAFL